jgi:transposase-like protein
MRNHPIDGETIAHFLDNVRRTRFRDGVHCVHCGFQRVHRHGKFSGRQRYRCMDCGRTFSDLTGTPLSYLKNLERCEDYAACLDDGLTIRKAAALLRVNPKTVFRWRHALLALVASTDETMLRERVELSDLWFALNQKGCRRLNRPARRRGVRCRSSYRGVVVRAIAACDRNGHAASGVAWARTVRLEHLVEVLTAHVGLNVVVHAAQGRLSHAARFAASVGGRFETTKATLVARKDRHAYADAHLHTVTAYCRQLRNWLRRFCGVATKYMAHYLAWHRLMERADLLGDDRPPESWPLWVAL